MHEPSSPWAHYADAIPADQPVLIAGATASGKSDLALYIAETAGGVIVNADALQVYSGWSVLTARPPLADEKRAPHQLYGHIPNTHSYSVGDWLREIEPFLGAKQRPIIVGGTGLYFRALTEGLAEIPQTPAEIRARAQWHFDNDSIESLLDDLDDITRDYIDTLNPMRVMRAWEVLQTTGKSIVWWHDNTPAPLLPLHSVSALHLDGATDWLNERISRRFDLMIEAGALHEAKAQLADWDPELQSSQAIGAPELISHLKGEITLEDAVNRAVIATRQYAKRQRTWFRKRMKNWTKITLPLPKSPSK